MGRRLKQIKKQDLGENAKKVVDSLIANTTKERKEEKLEQMRCKVEIYEGSTKRVLIDSFIVNTKSLENTIADIVLKYGANVQFTITNLYDEKVVSKRFVYTDGISKDREDRMFFNKQMELVKRIFKFKEEGKSVEEICDKLCHLAARSYIRELYVKTEEEIKQLLRDRYGNQSLGKFSTQDDILSVDLNSKKDILSGSNLDEETTDSGDENDE